MVMSGLMPTDVLTQTRLEVQQQFDSTVDWYQAGSADRHAERQYPTLPVSLPCRIVRRQEEVYDTSGTRTISNMRIYLNRDVPIKALDHLIPPGALAAKPPVILSIDLVPTIGEPIYLRVRLGAA